MRHVHSPAARIRLVSAALLAVTVGLCSVAAAADLKIIVPAAPGGGWDQLGRGVQQTLQAAKLADKVQVSNAAGAGGTIGPAQLINNNKGDGSALAGDEFKAYVESEQKNVLALVNNLGLVKK